METQKTSWEWFKFFTKVFAVWMAATCIVIWIYSETKGASVAESCTATVAAVGESMVGQTVSRVEAWEYGFTLIFADGSKVEVSGNQYGDCALGVEFTPPALEQDN